MELHTIGVDLGKTVFHPVGMNLRRDVVVRKRLSRRQLLQFTANLRVDLIGMEACGGAHFLEVETRIDLLGAQSGKDLRPVQQWMPAFH